MTKSRGKRILHARRRKEMARLYTEEGLTLRQIADVMGVVYQTVHAALRREKVPMRPRGGANHWRL